MKRDITRNIFLLLKKKNRGLYGSRVFVKAAKSGAFCFKFMILYKELLVVGFIVVFLPP